MSISFYPNAKVPVLASVSADHTVKFWNVETGSEITTLKGHADKITSSQDYIIRFSPDGKLLGTTADNNTILLWNFDLDNLFDLACDWARNYLNTNPNVSPSDKDLCKKNLVIERN
ncbi:WD40 repeat domain-containing protein [Crocosphaera chwakensis]|uniref:WD-40 repeat protein n=1 Tax=Crocosphaera chwakensis CCY0110 TaxID=391612 RepID=A3IUU1_9CHRO|nr:WD-40 repeat protein [Crocosphaera chwakensis]EAZ89784.1 WD-40 repeat protein [Crocosphaera chwakensis CCY0110]